MLDNGFDCVWLVVGVVRCLLRLIVDVYCCGFASLVGCLLLVVCWAVRFCSLVGNVV